MPRLSPFTGSFFLGLMGLSVLVVVAIWVLLPSPVFEFQEEVVDREMAGDCKMLGDIDGDGMLDLVIGGEDEEGLAWYRNPDWEKTIIAFPVVQFTTDGETGDMDGDGNTDIVIGDGDGEGNLLLYHNPTGQAGGGPDGRWQSSVIGTLGSWVKDIELADFDGDGSADVAARSRQLLKIYFSVPETGWVSVDLDVARLGREGLAAQDVDLDGHIDLLVQGAWLKNPGGESSRDAKAWAELFIGPAPNSFKVAAADLDKDGMTDVVYSDSEDRSDVSIFFGRQSGERLDWTRRVLAEGIEKAHSLRLADFDNDGDIDILVGQMHTSWSEKIMLFENRLRPDDAWARHDIGRGGIHNAAVADIDRDGDVDIFGANWTGNPPVRVLWNRSPALATDWTRVLVSKKHARTFGIAFGDLNKDGRSDVISGRFAYLQAENGVKGTWLQQRISDGIDYFALWKANDTDVGLLGSRTDTDLRLFYAESEKLMQGDREACEIGAIPAASHKIGSQGSVIADLGFGDSASLLIATAPGVYMVWPRSANLCEPWQVRRIADTGSDEGIAVADMDGDGLPDLVATTGRGKGVEWYRNPGKVAATWSRNRIGEVPEMVYPDRIAALDLNGDEQPEIIVSEENGRAAGAETLWWSQDSSGAWTSRLLARQGSTNSMSAGDLDRDGDNDILTIEHRGQHRAIAWCNSGHSEFVPVQIGRGYEAHLGAQLVDIDADGHLDIVNIGYDDPGKLWILKNPGTALCANQE